MELTLRMQEIYFLGKRLNGDHLNYSYIAAMPEISQRRAVIEQECEEALEKCGYRAKVAIVMLKTGSDVHEAEQRLEAHEGRVAQAVGEN